MSQLHSNQLGHRNYHYFVAQNPFWFGLYRVALLVWTNLSPLNIK